ncbi:PrgI family protein [Yinghuangia sp. ASG 101]|uniref:PrgI family protein n=1 Tax=Yinghuangia sp. ASG 101 TaxID=2896848 RepID=UPI001E2D9122|nr:PrgI family protein [Yinghuangia sp. ASG 101]UGQ13605.1 PrgI family protein [Yinghuangia sp. ASG 101]
MTQPPYLDDGATAPVRIPAIEQDDRILGPFTARQAAWLTAVFLLLWAGWLLTRSLVPGVVYLACAAPLAAVGTVAGFTRRDARHLDQWLLAVFRHARAPKRLAPAPDTPTSYPDWIDPELTRQAGPDPAPLALPADDVDETGVLRLGKDGAAALAVCGTVNFALRTSPEQAALVGAFARWLNAATGPVQILATARPVDLSGHVHALRERAGGLPHPALEDAALDHADFLDRLADGRDLLERRVVLALREPGRTHAAADRAAGRAQEAARALAAAELAVRPLDARQTAAILAAALDPNTRPVDSHHDHTPPTVIGGTP